MKKLSSIFIHGAYQNNLKGFDLELPLNQFIVVTGVSGSGKSSLAFDTIYAEGQRRYVETFSPYARQFLERMDPPKVDALDAIPPAIAIRQANSVKTSRSTVGTMTEVNDHLKLLFAKTARLFCPCCGKEIKSTNPTAICKQLIEAHEGERAEIFFEVQLPKNISVDEAIAAFEKQGYAFTEKIGEQLVRVRQDRIVITKEKQLRMAEALEAALSHGKGRCSVHFPASETEERFTTLFECADCREGFEQPTPNMFSFNSPIGACPTCRGFGRTIGISMKLVIPDESLSIAEGCIKPFQTSSFIEVQEFLVKIAKKRHFPINTPWRDLSEEQKRWVIEGEEPHDEKHWWGVNDFFQWMESRSYKMHVRVMLSRYREYTTCTDCNGSRLKPAALNWFLVVGERKYNIHELMLLPISEVYEFISEFGKQCKEAEAKPLLEELLPRLRYVIDAGLGYLTLDRQSRTLSGGELQRINLTTALGATLVNTLFILDEPSIGLHTTDVARLVSLLKRLRDAGNTVLVVEHDPEVIMAADRVIELGPGAGAAGGNIIFNGSVSELLSSKAALSGKYLSAPVSFNSYASTNNEKQKPIVIEGASEHNLKNVTVEIPTNKFVVVTGVSGSGKSTLINDVLSNAARRALGEHTEYCGEYKAIYGIEQFSQVVVVDQAPIGKTARSTPVGYIGAFDELRKYFASQQEAQEHGFTAGDFSYNAGRGRCPVCEGTGHELVELQFLSDVYLKCEACNGTRYIPEILEIKVPCHSGKKSIADILELTIAEAAVELQSQPRILKALQPLLDVGLGYLTVGQPLPTLSGGETQRLKLAAFLAEYNSSKKQKAGGAALFILDEPTTGLHFQDIEVLLRVLRELVARGNSVVIIEHNLMVINQADWIIDLGPGGGDAGGRVIAQGVHEDIMAAVESQTGHALSEELERNQRLVAESAAELAPEQDAIVVPPESICVQGAREHNLKGVDVSLPLNKFTVITGVSGSGKSTLAFDILFALGQRRYLECLNAYARQFVQPQAKPEVQLVSALPPTVAIEQRISRGGWRSTVATVSELQSDFRVLYLSCGEQHCPSCGTLITKQTAEEITSSIKQTHGKKGALPIRLLARLVAGRKGQYKELAKWALEQGVKELRVDGKWQSTEKWKLPDRYSEHDVDIDFYGELDIQKLGERELLEMVKHTIASGKGSLRILEVGKQRANEYALSTERACPSCGLSFEEPSPKLFSFNSKHGWCPKCQGYGLNKVVLPKKSEHEDTRNVDFATIEAEATVDASAGVCPACNGARLSPEALSYYFHGKNIDELCSLSIAEAIKFFKTIKLTKREQALATTIISDVLSRLGFLDSVGLGYLSLNRAVPTLSGGEGQRIRLAAQLGSELAGVCYILDEPTIGLHDSDTAKLLKTIRGLCDRGNTVIVVEHDEQVMRAADYILDLGPGAGVKGGTLVAEGPLKQLLKNKKSITANCLKNPLQHPINGSYRDCTSAKKLVLEGVTMHNLKNRSFEFPIERLSVVTGVSGSGKSTLVRDVLYSSLAPITGGGKPKLVGCKKILGAENFKRVLEVDQSPIGRTPRSCPATYVGFWTEIRELFASSPDAAIRGYDASRFSFNIEGGRCSECGGQGVVRSEMSFLPDVVSQCPVCGGSRFNEETLAVRYCGKTIADVLAMDVDTALEFFGNHPKLHYSLTLLKEVGLGYLSLGQQSSTLSGGEAQRIKLVAELARCTPKLGQREQATLYVLDEPTVGLHMADVLNLIRVVHKLVEHGHTMIMIEHNHDVVAEADYVLTLER